MLNTKKYSGLCMLNNIKCLPLHCVFHGIRVKVNEDWESGKIPFFYARPFRNCFEFIVQSTHENGNIK